MALSQGRTTPVGRALLGVTPGTARPALPEKVAISDRPENSIRCPGGHNTARRPGEISAQVWYPARLETQDLGVPIAENIARGGPYPLVLYAHAKRRWLTCPEHIPEPLLAAYADPGGDFRRADRILSQLAAQGFVVASPDLGWLVETFESGDWESGGLPRARMLLALQEHLRDYSAQWKIDFGRLGLVGHSTGGGACLALLDRLPHVKFVGLIAPGGEERWLANARKSPATLLILVQLELQLVHDPMEHIFRHAPRPRVLLRIAGANHLGFTDLCSEDNRVCMDGDPPGLIDRRTQQDLAARYLSAMARLTCYGDPSARALLQEGTLAEL